MEDRKVCSEEVTGRGQKESIGKVRKVLKEVAMELDSDKTNGDLGRRAECPALRIEQ